MVIDFFFIYYYFIIYIFSFYETPFSWSWLSDIGMSRSLNKLTRMTFDSSVNIQSFYLAIETVCCLILRGTFFKAASKMVFVLNSKRCACRFCYNRIQTVLPVRTQPSSRNISLVCAGKLKYPLETWGPRTHISPDRLIPKLSPVSTSTIWKYLTNWNKFPLK